ncbi:MAG: glycerol-3-phosphate 1-O-acyltransferase PlsY [Pseudomonadota bacterium]|nr:glycerol-3-phosphate 1-O-acyltransferase PlsY [Pseudomonadota bacterium]
MSENFLTLLTHPDTLFTILLLYIIGSLPFAIISSRLMNLPDPRSYGSNNPGATNVLRTGNKFAAFVTLLGDSLKGFIPVIILISIFSIDIYISYLLSLFILLGHMFSVFLRFKGGKGVATSFGIIFALDFRVGFCLLLIWLISLYVFRVSAISAIISFLLLPFLIMFFIDNDFIIFLAIINSILIITKHLDSISDIRNFFK